MTSAWFALAATLSTSRAADISISCSRRNGAPRARAIRAAAVAARRRLHDRGVTEPLRIAISQAVRATSSDTVLDAGCGDGFYLGGLHSETGCDAHGVDISTPAVEAAARRYPECEWVVANADRALPYADRSFHILLSITARMNAVEFRRVLRDDGRMLIALPAPDDLIELRGTGRDRVDRTLDTFANGFRLDRSESRVHLSRSRRLRRRRRSRFDLPASATAARRSATRNPQPGSAAVSSRLKSARAVVARFRIIDSKETRGTSISLRISALRSRR